MLSICEITKSTEHPEDSTKLSLIYVIGMWGTKGGSIFCNYFPRCESDRLMVLGLITGARATIEESRDVFELFLLPLCLGIAKKFHSNELVFFWIQLYYVKSPKQARLNLVCILTQNRSKPNGYEANFAPSSGQCTQFLLTRFRWRQIAPILRMVAVVVCTR